MTLATQFLKDESGQDLVEYALLLALVVLAAASSLGLFANNVSGAWDNLVAAVQGLLGS